MARQWTTPGLSSGEQVRLKQEVQSFHPGDNHLRVPGSSQTLWQQSRLAW